MGTKLSTVKTRTTSSEEACIINILPENDNCCLVEEYDANLNRIRSKNIDLGFSSKNLALTRMTKYEFILKGGINAALVNLRTFIVQQMSAEYTKSITHSLGGHLLHHFPNEIRTTTRNMRNPVTLYQSSVHIKSLHVVNDNTFVFTNTAGFVYKVGVGITHSFQIYTDDVFLFGTPKHTITLHWRRYCRSSKRFEKNIKVCATTNRTSTQCIRVSTRRKMYLHPSTNILCRNKSSKALLVQH
jgi:hypothetical protein